MIIMNTVTNISISSSLGEYLKAICELSNSQPTVRTTDIAEKLGISKPSVNKAVNTLKAKGYVTHQPYGAVILTDTGRSLGEDSDRKNLMIKKFLINVLHLSELEAESEARSMAYSVSYGTVEKMRSFMER